MEEKFKDLRAEVYHSQNDIKYLKVSYLGLYINSITARPSPRYPDKGLWIQLPSFRTEKGKWIQPIERNPNSSLWKAIEKKCREAASCYTESIGLQGDEEGDAVEREFNAALDAALDRL